MNFNSTNGVIPELYQTVCINGIPTPWITCTAIRRAVGCGTNTAEFKLPQHRFDSERSFYSDQLAQVYINSAGYEPDIGGTPEWVGCLDAESAQLADNDSVALTGNPVTFYLTKVWVGQSEYKPKLKWPLFDEATGVATGWTPELVLKDLWARLPYPYGELVKLGDTSVLKLTTSDMGVELVIRTCTYSQALEYITGLYGDVIYQERYEGQYVFLDFFRVLDPRLPTVTVRAAAWDDPVETGANIASVTKTVSSAEATSRVLVYGAPLKTVMTLTNVPQWEIVVHDNDDSLLTVVNNGGFIDLLKGWDSRFELAVAKDPKVGRPGQPGYQQGMEHVFRRWYLPTWMRRNTKHGDLPLRSWQAGLAEPQGYQGPQGVPEAMPLIGSDIPAQVIRWGTYLEIVGSQGWQGPSPAPPAGWQGTQGPQMVYPAGYAGPQCTGTQGPQAPTDVMIALGKLNPTPELVQNAKFDLSQNCIELGNAVDGLNCWGSYLDAKGKQNWWWLPAALAVTLTVEHDYAVTGDTAIQSNGSYAVPPVTALPIDAPGGPGSVLCVDRDDLDYVQLGNVGLPLYASTTGPLGSQGRSGVPTTARLVLRRGCGYSGQRGQRRVDPRPPRGAQRLPAADYEGRPAQGPIPRTEHPANAGAAAHHGPGDRTVLLVCVPTRALPQDHGVRRRRPAGQHNTSFL